MVERIIFFQTGGLSEKQIRKRLERPDKYHFVEYTGNSIVRRDIKRTADNYPSKLFIVLKGYIDSNDGFIDRFADYAISNPQVLTVYCPTPNEYLPPVSFVMYAFNPETLSSLNYAGLVKRGKTLIKKYLRGRLQGRRRRILLKAATYFRSSRKNNVRGEVLPPVPYFLSDIPVQSYDVETEEN